MKHTPKQSLADHAVDTIRERILDLTLRPGSQIEDRFLIEEFHLSRTPVREAMNRLAAEQLIEIRSNHGFFVKPLDFASVAAFFDAFHVSEQMIGHFCCFDEPMLVADLEEIQIEHTSAVENQRFREISRSNASFHMRIARASQNPHILDFSARLHNIGRRLSYFVYQTERDAVRIFFESQQDSIVAEHNQIIDFIRCANRPNLIVVLREHSERFQVRIARWVERTKSADFTLRK